MGLEKRCFGCVPAYQHREGISRRSQQWTEPRAREGKDGWRGSVSLYSNGVSSSQRRELPGVRGESVVGLDYHGSPSKELRQDNEKD